MHFRFLSAKWNAATRYSARPFTTKTGARVRFFCLNSPRNRGWYQARVHPFSSGNGKGDLKSTSLRTEQPQPSGTSLLLRFTSGRLKYHSWVASPWTSSVLISGSKYDPGPWTFQGTWRDLQAGITSIACSIIKYMSCQVGSFPFRKLSIQYTHTLMITLKSTAFPQGSFKRHAWMHQKGVVLLYKRNTVLTPFKYLAFLKTQAALS